MRTGELHVVPQLERLLLIGSDGALRGTQIKVVLSQ